MYHDKYIVYFISRTKQKMTAFLTRQLREKQMDHLIPSHGNILTVLYENGEQMALNEISRRIGRDKSTVTPLVNRLVELGYVTKQPCAQDRRITLVCLTDAGRALKPRFDEISHSIHQTAYRGFSEEEKQTFLRLLKKMNQNFSDPA